MGDASGNIRAGLPADIQHRRQAVHCGLVGSWRRQPAHGADGTRSGRALSVLRQRALRIRAPRQKVERVRTASSTASPATRGAGHRLLWPAAFSKQMQSYRRRLPHWIPDDTVIFVTWRLFNSAPPIRPAILTAESVLSGQTQRSGPLWLQNPRIARRVDDAIQYGETRNLYSL